MNRVRKRKRKAKGSNTSLDEKLAGKGGLSSEKYKSISHLHELQGVPLEQELSAVSLPHELDGIPRAELEGNQRWVQ